MLNLLGNSPPTACNRVTRRTALQAAGSGLLGLSLANVMAAEQLAPSTSKLKPRAKSVIFMFLFGGPSQLETFDCKPDAPAKIRGPFMPIACRTPDLRISEHLPRVAGITDQLCVIRTMTHNYNDHSGGGHYIQTGHRWQVPLGGGFNATNRDWPSMGSVTEYVEQHRAGAKPSELPNYAVLPNFLGKLQEFSSQLRRPGEYGGWLGRGYDGLTTNITKRSAKDNPYFRACTDDELKYEIQGLSLPEGITLDRLEKRQTLVSQFDDSLRQLDHHAGIAAWDRLQQRAWSLATSSATRKALNLTEENPDLRDRYGRNLFGQSTLMARRLVEAGTRFVTVHFDACDGQSWDSHSSSNDVKKHLLPSLDNALASLVEDLKDRGMLDETLVVCMGEMGRTPQANATWGRSHWSTLFPAVLAGGGIKRGIVYGSSDKDAAYPIDKPVTPEDLAATIYTALGIDPHMQLADMQGRPVPIVDGGCPLEELFG
ncbi:hypothetical protein ETAA8_52500 [Anatilimnocola aggregata]|uniref:DUF1501 domain-containing protein n=1 Tax=Anatilimnocola aggregata TaxID=2528021 RepID=A0A517YIV3_9BACT|nr:DUF1501 domain-containing protein [Anatilimnocola aggregata]QDU30131.1 hypothetical protein ETAA8_52500 [Anatilimnocola aggregata]